MASHASGFQRIPGGWEWPENLPRYPPSEQDSSAGASGRASNQSYSSDQTPRPRKQRHFRPRTCRICLETVLPSFHAPSEDLPELLQGEPRVTYDSEGGRLLRPCKCKGSSKYVHEVCLQEWRYADPGFGKRNYYHCPTCKFKYRLRRMSWANWISGTVTQLALTLLIINLAAFAMGYFADPIINLYLDPWSTITASTSLYDDPLQDMGLGDFEEEDGWIMHFFKGFTSLGLLGFVKVFFSLGPWNWFNVRHYIGGGTQTGNTGRDRVASVSSVVVFLGLCTFFYTVWKIVRAWSKRVLERASESVMDVQGDNDDDDDDNE